jgi:hypothetical protein
MLVKLGVARCVAIKYHSAPAHLPCKIQCNKRTRNVVDIVFADIPEAVAQASSRLGRLGPNSRTLAEAAAVNSDLDIAITIIMSTLHDFLVEHAKFPFPHPNEHGSVSTTDISELEVGRLERRVPSETILLFKSFVIRSKPSSRTLL